MANKKHIPKPEKWVDYYGDALYHYAFKRVLSQKVAEDLVQETFLSALKGLDRFKGDSSEKTWLFAILKNKIIDHFRKIQSRREEQVNFSMPFHEHGIMFKRWEKERRPAKWQVKQDEMLEYAEFKKIFEDCLSTLPPRLAAVFALKIVEECESDEVCKELEISASNFWVMMHRARLRLRECMEKHWVIY